MISALESTNRFGQVSGTRGRFEDAVGAYTGLSRLAVIIRETVLIVTHDAYAFVFIFAGSHIGLTNNLMAATKVKFTP